MAWLLNNFFNARALRTYGFITLMLIGGCAMSADIELSWEWPAERAIEDRILVKVESVKPKSAGLFGILNSPSLAGSLPDPIIVSGVVINSDNKLNGKSIQVVAPKLEIENIKKGIYAMLGIVENTICICIVPVENKDSDLNNIKCP